VATNGTRLMYCRNGGTPLVMGMSAARSVWNRSVYAMMNADAAMSASEPTYSVTRSRLCRWSIPLRASVWSRCGRGSFAYARFRRASEARPAEARRVRPDAAAADRAVDRPRDGVGERLRRQIVD